MSEYGATCKLCEAKGDYCHFQSARGCADIDCRHVADILTEEQRAWFRERFYPEWARDMDSFQANENSGINEKGANQ